jgi:myo-inositol 2-dehydrogenase / D-chiro-inositol 1-dehydrogenase
MRVAVLGAGRIGHVHASHLVTDRRVTELLIADTDETRALALAGTSGEIASAVSVDAAFDARPDAVIIGAPTPVHGTLLRRCVELGIPTLCEKPLAKTLEETVQLVRVVEDANALVQVGLMRRFEPGNVRLRTMLERGELGTVLCIRAASHDREPPDRGYVGGSGGLFRDQMIHDFDAIRWVTQQEVRSVYAAARIRTLTFLEEFGDFDTAAVTLELEDGVLAVVVASREDGRGEDYRIEVIGTQDSVATGTNEHTPLLNLDATPDTLANTPYDGPTARFGAAYSAQTVHFISVAEGSAANRCSPRDALASVLVSIAAETSTTTGVAELVPAVADVLAR